MRIERIFWIVAVDTTVNEQLHDKVLESSVVQLPCKVMQEKQFQQNICEAVAQAAILYPDQVVLDVFLGGFIEVDQNSCLDPFQP